MKLEKKKKPAKPKIKLHKKYPQFAFRIPSNENDAEGVIEKLMDDAERVKMRRNKNLGEDSEFKLISRNDVLLEAVRIGLKKLLREINN